MFIWSHHIYQIFLDLSVFKSILIAITTLYITATNIFVS